MNKNQPGLANTVPNYFSIHIKYPLK